MYHLHCFFTQNSMKTLYVAEALECEFTFHFVNLMRGENHSDEFKRLSLTRKVPLLVHNGVSLFESGAICRYLASAESSKLYPQDLVARAQVDQWLDYFVNHPGRWLTSLYFQKIIKPKAGLGEPDENAIEEAEKFSHASLKVVERWLAEHEWLANDALSIADLTALAYMEQAPVVAYSLQDYPSVVNWYRRLEALDSTARARQWVAPHVQALLQ